MKILTFSTRDATFKLDNVDIGDYIEVEYRAPLGVQDHFQIPQGPLLRVYGFSMLLTFWCQDEDIAVEFRTASKYVPPILMPRGYGERLVMKPTRFAFGGRSWSAITINGRHGLSPKLET
jgi:hypothetical protein